MFLNKKIIDDYNAGTTQNELYKKYKMSQVVISRLVNKYKTKGTVETEHLGDNRRKILLTLIAKLLGT